MAGHVPIADRRARSAQGWGVVDGDGTVWGAGIAAPAAPVHRFRPVASRPLRRVLQYGGPVLVILTAVVACGSGGGDTASSAPPSVSVVSTSSTAAPTTTVLPTTVPVPAWAEGKLGFASLDGYKYLIEFSFEEPWPSTVPMPRDKVEITVPMTGEVTVTNALPDRPVPPPGELTFWFWYETDVCGFGGLGSLRDPATISGVPVCQAVTASSDKAISAGSIGPGGTIYGFANTMYSRTYEAERIALLETLLSMGEPDYIVVTTDEKSLGSMCGGFGIGMKDLGVLGVVKNHDKNIPSDQYSHEATLKDAVKGGVYSGDACTVHNGTAW